MLPYIKLSLRPEPTTFPPPTINLSDMTTPGGVYTFLAGDSGADWLMDNNAHRNYKDQGEQQISLSTFGSAAYTYQSEGYFWPATYEIEDAGSTDANTRGGYYTRIVGISGSAVDAGTIVTVRASRSVIKTLYWLGGVEQGTYRYTASLSDGIAAPAVLTVPAPQHGGAIVEFLAGSDDATLQLEIRRTVGNGSDGKIFAGVQYVPPPVPVPMPAAAKAHLLRLGLFGGSN